MSENKFLNNENTKNDDLYLNLDPEKVLEKMGKYGKYQVFILMYCNLK